MTRILLRATAAIVFAAIALASFSAGAWGHAVTCGPRDAVLDVLRLVYEEAPDAQGIRSNGSLVQVFRTGDGKKWTIVVIQPGGIACLVLHGDDWTNLLWHLPDPKPEGSELSHD